MEGKQSKIIIFTGPSGGGKTTLSKYILNVFASEVERAISVTTRKPRKEEVEGEDYYFYTPKEFEAEIEADNFIEWEQVYEGLYYGILEKEVERVWNDGKYVLFVVDVVGANSLKEHFGDRAINIFVKTPTMKILSDRLFFRGTETPDEIYKRLDKAEGELEYEKYADVVIVNDVLEESKAQSLDIISGFIQ